MADRLQQEFVAILDFGSQYAQLIARRVREAHVYCELVPPGVDPRSPEKNLKGVILSGGPASVYDEGAPTLPEWLKSSDVPVLSICYGMQLMAHALGGGVRRAARREYGAARVRVLEESHPLFEGMPAELDVWMSHGDQVEALPPGFRAIAESENCAFAAIANEDGSIGLQFHPEVVHTPLGTRILQNFLYNICRCSADWTPQRYIDDHVQSISQKIGGATALCALSGGVDSMVAATLVDRAIGDRLSCFFVDTGLLREGEADEVMRSCEDLDLNVRKIEAGEAFLASLEGISDPEEKRRRIGGLFIDVFVQAAREYGNPPYLVQGTLYPDVIESATAENPNAAKIKTHHNVGGLPKDMPFTLVEPLRYLFKDEVREVGRALGLPDKVVGRQPFPGPGLAVRIIGEISEERLEKRWQYAQLPGVREVQASFLNFYGR